MSFPLTELPNVSIVIIGRNEARNIPTCIQSIREMDYPQDKLEIMYVDTDSNDGSPEVALTCGVTVHEEHSNFPSAGRARNRGWHEAKYNTVHFIDGDMTIAPQYLREAVLLIGKDGVAGVIGRLKERYADRNFIAHILEYPWAAREAGFVDAPGAGGTLLRTALAEVDGYNAEILRGQETELGYRLRQRGYKIILIDQTMGTHDYEVHNLVDLWKWYATKGRSFMRILRLPPSESIAGEQRAGHRAIQQFVLAILGSGGLLLSGLWWVFAFIPVLLSVYIVFRYWQPTRFRGLRIANFMCEYFFKPAIWVGMIKYEITRK